MQDIIKKIKNLEIQSSTTIALRSLLYLQRFARQNGFGSRFDEKCEKLLKVRTTGVLLFNVLKELKKDKCLGKIDELIRMIRSHEEKIAENGKNLIKSNYVIHTHCHSTEAIAVIKSAAKKKRFTVVIDETRPREQGIKTAKELAKIKNIQVVLITDSAAGIALSPFIPPNDNLVIVGADALRPEGVINKIGTYLLAVAANEQGIPFCVATSTLKIDRRKKLELEFRPPSEVYHKIKGVEIINPAFDITPYKYVSYFITEKGVFTSMEFRKKFLLHMRGKK